MPDDWGPVESGTLREEDLLTPQLLPVASVEVEVLLYATISVGFHDALRTVAYGRGGMTDVMTTTLVMTIVEGPGVVALDGSEDVWADGTSTVGEMPVDSEVEYPLGKLDDALPLPLPLLELGPTGEYGGGAEY